MSADGFPDFTEDGYPYWAVDRKPFERVPEECAYLSMRPATPKEAAFALTLPS